MAPGNLEGDFLGGEDIALLNRCGFLLRQDALFTGQSL